MDNSCWQGNVYGNVIAYFIPKPLKKVMQRKHDENSQTSAV